MSQPSLSVSQFKEHLRPLIDAHQGGMVAFDADGTLWSHDVGCMVYDYATDHELFKAEAADALKKECTRHGFAIANDASVSECAHTLQKAWEERRYGEREAAEMQVWAYVGFSKAEFRELVRTALQAGQHLKTLHAEILELAAWVREAGARAVVVSASPLWVVEEAVEEFSFDSIAAGVPNQSDGTIAAGMASPLPYGPDKVVAGRALLEGGAWLAALGDSAFDLEMMREAMLAGGIGDKPSMLSGLRELPHGHHLQLG